MMKERRDIKMSIGKRDGVLYNHAVDSFVSQTVLVQVALLWWGSQVMQPVISRVGF